MKKIVYLLITLLPGNALIAQTWDGSTSTDWNTASNWSTNTVPQATGNVTIPGGALPNWPVLHADITVNTFDMNAGSQLDFNGFSLTSTSTVSIRAVLNNSNAATDIVVTSNNGGGGGSNYMGGCIVNDNFILNTKGTAITYEGYNAANMYNGNATYNLGGTGRFYSSYHEKCMYNGNLTVNRTVAGTTDLFNAGFISINGNFTYNNMIGGHTYINSGNNTVGPINGTLNITATGTGNPEFYMRKIKNLTGGGAVSVQNCGANEVDNDTMIVVSVNVTGFSGGSNDGLSECVITGDLTYAEAATNTGSVYLGRNTVNGNTVLGSNANTTWYEGYIGGITYNGNTTFNLNGTGRFNSSYNQKCSFDGNLTVNRTGIGITDLFNAGFNFITGNFSYTNTVGGPTYINSGNTTLGPIGGMLNVTASGPGNPDFYMRRIKNLTGGGNVFIQNCGEHEIDDDTLNVVAVTVNGFSSAGTDGLSNCVISGDLTYIETAGNAGAVYMGGNIIHGNTTITSNTVVTWYESYNKSNYYNGNLTLSRNAAGSFQIAYHDTTYVGKSLVFNSNAGFDVNTTIEFNSSNNGIVEQLGTQPIVIPRLVMNKTGGASITLNDSVTITTSAGFYGGNIYTSAANSLIFPNNVVTHTSTSASSHVIGPVTKIGDEIFTFPVGGPVSYNPVAMSAPSGSTSRFRAEYKNQNPTSDGYNTSSKAGTFGAAAISKAGYWDVQRLAGATNVTLTLGFGTNPYETYPTPLTSLKVAHWNGTQWDDHGNAAPTGTPASGTVNNSVAITSFSPFTLAGVIPTYFYIYSTPGPGPDGTPVKVDLIGGYPTDSIKQLPGVAYTTDSIFLIANGSSVGFKGKDFYGVEKDDTTVTVAAAPLTYISANGNGTLNFTGWRHFVYMRNGSNQIMGAIKDSGLTLGNTTMNTYFSTANVATSPNGNIYLKRSFKITSEFAPAGAKRVVRFYITKTEFNDLVAADPTAFPNGINSLTITKYNGPMEDSLFNPQPGGNAVIIPNSAIMIVDMGTMYLLDIAVDGFSGFYIGGNNMNLNLCSGSTITLPVNINGATYQWQVDNGGGFSNISNGGIYSGATKSALTITNPPNTIYGYKYRALVNGGTPSQVYTIKLNISWTGAVSTAWENVANWSCGALPNDNTDVVINAGKPNFPQLNSNISIRSLRVNPGATVTIKTGFTLTVKK
ncbi:MAG: hypothetical protein V4722_00775 [Bacteroidota bacterium]